MPWPPLSPGVGIQGAEVRICAPREMTATSKQLALTYYTEEMSEGGSGGKIAHTFVYRIEAKYISCQTPSLRAV